MNVVSEIGGVAERLDPNGFKVGDNDITVPLDEAIYRGGDNWDALKGSTISINILTLIRNALGAYDADTSGRSSIEMFKSESNISEILVPRIRDDLAHFSMYMEDVHNAKVLLHGVEYGRLALGRLPNYRVARTDKQKANKSIVNSVLNIMNKEISWYSNRIPSNITHLISHVPYDALIASSGIKVVESHTGVIKSLDDLNGKLRLTDDEKYVVPFNTITYLLYGDGVILNKNVKITRSVYNVLLKARITPMSTRTRFNMAIKNNDPILSKAIGLLTSIK